VPSLAAIIPSLASVVSPPPASDGVSPTTLLPYQIAYGPLVPVPDIVTSLHFGGDVLPLAKAMLSVIGNGVFPPAVESSPRAALHALPLPPAAILFSVAAILLLPTRVSFAPPAAAALPLVWLDIPRLAVRSRSAGSNSGLLPVAKKAALPHSAAVHFPPESPLKLMKVVDCPYFPCRYVGVGLVSGAIQGGQKSHDVTHPY
jgi:hypothetical protein